MRNKFHDLLNETTVTGGAPDDGSTGPASDDDAAPGTTVFGDKYMPVVVPNRLTGSTIKHVPAADLKQEWNYDEFENSMSMGSIKAYSQTLQGLEKLLGSRLFNHTDRRKFRMGQDKWIARGGEQDGSGVTQTARLGDDEEESVEELEMDIKEKIGLYLGEPEEVINEFVVDKNDRKALSKAIMGKKPVKLFIDSVDGISASVVHQGNKVLVTYVPNE
jgi:hypothetical protein